MHHHILKKLKQKETHEEIEARRDKNHYFDIFRGYAEKQKPALVEKALMSDFKHWEVPNMPQLMIVGQQGYRDLIQVMIKHASTLLVSFKRLQSSSDSFPALTYKTVNDWANNIDIIDTDYSVTMFLRDYLETRVPEKKP